MRKKRSEEQPPGAPPGPAGEAGSQAERIYTFADSLEQSGDWQEEAPEQPETFVTFGLQQETFALPVTYVLEIIRVQEITRVPHAPFPVRGITTLRGQILPVVDLRLRIELPAAQISPASRILVILSRGRKLGLLVDRVSEVVRLLPSRVQPVPADVMSAQSEYISGVYERDRDLFILLSLDKVLLIPDSLEAARRQEPRKA